MKSLRESALARLGRESAEHIHAATLSIEQSRAHVRQSKHAVRRSLYLLKETKLGD